MEKNRRNFIKNMGGALIAIPSFNIVDKTKKLKSNIISENTEHLKIGLIGAGIIGHYDIDTALKVQGVELVAVCDLYAGRLAYAKEKWGNKIFTTKDYRELLAKKEIDAVLICTPDHWHQRIGIAALKAGKHVYCEKPMVQKIEEGMALIYAQKASGKVFQVGSQRASSVAIIEAKKILKDGKIGELTMVEAFCDRSEARGAWQYSIPTDASPETVDFDKFLGHAPKVPFDAKRFFRWRNYKDYGTGVAGDLIVHLLTGIHTMTDAIGPKSIYCVGDLKLWKDGRDAYDNINALMPYKATKNHGSFNVVTRVNLTDGRGNGGFGIKLIGTEGVIDIGWNDFVVKTITRHQANGYGGYDSFESFSAKQKEDFKKWYKANYGEAKTGYSVNKETAFNAEKDYDDRLDHFKNFFNSIRIGSKNVEDVSFGFRTAAPSIACNTSIEKEKVINWDPITMRLI